MKGVVRVAVCTRFMGSVVVMVFLLSQMYLNGLTERFDAIGIGLTSA